VQAPLQIQQKVDNVRPESIIVFHDSVKAWKNLKVALPEVLKALTKKGFLFQALAKSGKFSG
jgi:hypothetical protein